ncbi:hypothetical protein JTB14_029517 [Gonioctena quinquepunctata]|nr:hypothetical protein JTB14_029517 [Gonioctena quinquepunctata]
MNKYRGKNNYEDFLKVTFDERIVPIEQNIDIEKSNREHEPDNKFRHKSVSGEFENAEMMPSYESEVERRLFEEVATDDEFFRTDFSDTEEEIDDFASTVTLDPNVPYFLAQNMAQNGQRRGLLKLLNIMKSKYSWE